jgi:hypothetical protein
MRLSIPLAASIAALALLSSGPVQAQGTPQTVQLAKIDVVKAATGFRASKVIGAGVVNDANETIGKVDDVILGTDKASYIILSVGGFLGMGNKLVALPYEALKLDGEVHHAGRHPDALKSLRVQVRLK